MTCVLVRLVLVVVFEGSDLGAVLRCGEGGLRKGGGFLGLSCLSGGISWEQTESPGAGITVVRCCFFGRTAHCAKWLSALSRNQEWEFLICISLLCYDYLLEMGACLVPGKGFLSPKIGIIIDDDEGNLSSAAICQSRLRESIQRPADKAADRAFLGGKPNPAIQHIYPHSAVLEESRYLLEALL